MLTLLVRAVLPLCSVLPQAAADWPCFGGPTHDHRAPALATKFAWKEKPPTVKWRAKTGPGYAGPAIQGGEVFLFDCELGESEMLRVFDLVSGTEKWSVSYEAKGRGGFPGTRAVPTVTADAVYTCGEFGHIACFDRAKHEVRWIEQLQETYGGEDPGFGWSGAPLLLGDLVVFTAAGADVGLVALDRTTGEERWVSDGFGYTHSTPASMTLLGEPQIVILSTSDVPSGNEAAAPMRITSIDPKDGHTKWHHEITLTRLPVPVPVQIDEQRFFVTGGYRGGSTLVKIAKKDDAYVFEELFHVARGAQVHAPLLHGDYLYLVANENWNELGDHAEGGLMCLGLDGKERWRTGDAPYTGRGHALLAGENLLFLDGFDGTLRVARATPDGYQPIAEAKLFTDTGLRDGQMWAPMALSGELLVMRNQEELICAEL